MCVCVFGMEAAGGEGGGGSTGMGERVINHAWVTHNEI